MPANLSPEYRQAEQAFRSAHEPRARLGCLKEMLRTIPKHKGTEHIQADIKSRIRELTRELSLPHKGPAHAGAGHTLGHEGVAQICLIGPPNAGKSSLHSLLTGSKAEVAPFPYTTRQPLAGLLPFEDIAFQLIDLPPISAERLEPELTGILHSTDAVWLVIDLADPDCSEQLLTLCAQLKARGITLSDRWPGRADAVQPGSASQRSIKNEPVPDPFGVELPTLLVANKSDLDEISVLEELTGVRFPAVATSAVAGTAIDRLAPFLFQALCIVRVYTKAPGKPPVRTRPFTVRRGATVLDVARLVHHDLASTLKFARVWGSGLFEGQQVGPEHPVADGDIVELHAR
jgi:ribosome-interacting GTPase 1